MARHKLQSLGSDVLHVLAVLQVLLARRLRLQAVVAAVADLRLGTLRAARLVDAVVEACRADALAAPVEEPSVGVRAHARASVSAA